ncbi:type VI secretion system protein TssA [Ochrobactrum sp. GPK 3]|uniref:type VI secretion system protein TssA n=1 Tax=Brucella sp. 22210 TaxID=3453892 RepID=UPI0031384CEE
MDVTLLTAPISEGSPCGINIREHDSTQSLYYELKDARNSARAIERSFAIGDAIGVSQHWTDVNSLALQILSEYSKDLEVFCWLAEAQVRLRGFVGLRDTFNVLSIVVHRYGMDLHSVSSDTIEERVAPLNGLNGRGSDGVLLQALRLVSLVPDSVYGVACLWDYQRAQRPDEEILREQLQQAVAEKGRSQMIEQLQCVESCIEQFDALNQALESICDSDAPASSNIRQVLCEVAAAIKDMARLETAVNVGEVSQELFVSADNGIEVPELSLRAPVSITSREEAFKVLLCVAHFFKCTEPHSPTSQVLETLVARGRMDFQTLLKELLPDDAIRLSVISAAGIQPKAEPEV